MAVRINRVYTRKGDDGTTGLVGGRRVSKDDPRVVAYGEVDELSSVIGLARSILCSAPYRRRVAAAKLDRALAEVQQELFDLGSELATDPRDARPQAIRIGPDHVTRLERRIDELQADLDPLSSFVLPGGGTAGSALHLARCVCRRAERAVVALVRSGGARPEVLRYLNRLSDLLFVEARWIAKKTGHREVLWEPGQRKNGT
ncbi:MAG: cob(I)yrinic acid a,c-diamide adenosyltransferase [Candidatus Dadabacteria bacterium]|nr:MAG: cob(I)yrinic acid a,c-diamide adenosyltransferase [Candidatus Dadabacteria bacterium]